jgi:plastocyanin
MNRLRTLVLLLACVALAAVAAGCGSSNNDSSSSSSSSSAAAPAAADTSSTESTSSSASGGKEVEVKMQNIAFAPKDVTVKVGQTVKWSNEDTVDHNVTAKSGATFKSDLFGKGGTFTFKADKAGSITYVCTVHPGMEGTITVTK